MADPVVTPVPTAPVAAPAAPVASAATPVTPTPAAATPPVVVATPSAAPAVSYCSRCSEPHNRVNQRYCAPCHAAYSRKWRRLNPMTPEQRMKDSARSYANVYKRRGILIQEPCEDCGSPDSEMHHEDYTKPIDVTWLCRACHLALHKEAA